MSKANLARRDLLSLSQEERIRETVCSMCDVTVMMCQQLLGNRVLHSRA
jgi:hypothetical protein